MASTSVVLPWSTCAMMAMLRTSERGAASARADGGVGADSAAGGSGGGEVWEVGGKKGNERGGRRRRAAARGATPLASA